MLKRNCSNIIGLSNNGLIGIVKEILYDKDKPSLELQKDLF